ncbi:MAG: hypothetical protein HOP09_10735 [Hyphomicrobium sp.]|nr:hypothetical protein [Hyphomicrobium sp.]
MEEAVGKIFGVIAIIAAVVFDWPRAIAGVLLGFFVRRSAFAYPMIVLIAGVVAIAGIGELIYPLIGRTASANWGSFTLGLVSSGATAYGLFRYIFSIFGN